MSRKLVHRLLAYRVEHPATGLGPFSPRCPPRLRDAISDHCGRAGFFLPEAHVDCPGFTAGSHLCAVFSLAHVNAWFGPFRAQLLDAGFVLMAYEPLPYNVSRGASNTQLAFILFEATPRRALDWPEPGAALVQLRLFP